MFMLMLMLIRLISCKGTMYKSIRLRLRACVRAKSYYTMYVSVCLCLTIEPAASTHS